MEKLNKVAVHNLNEERSMGFVNYDLHIRGKHCLEAASRKISSSKSMDLLESAEPGDINKYRKPAKDIKELKLKWKDHLQTLQSEAYSEEKSL